MSTWEIIAERTKELPLELQLQVLAFLDSLTQLRPPRALKSPAGLWADLRMDIRPEDIAQARQEMWANFPREKP
jgi:hypothetical protein